MKLGRRSGASGQPAPPVVVEDGNAISAVVRIAGDSGPSKEHAHNGLGIKRTARSNSEFLHCLAARSRALCAFAIVARSGTAVARHEMLALHLEAGEVSMRQAAVPERPSGFALIRTLVAGICNTDLELLRGYYEFAGTPGHEFVGEVVEADDQALIGKRVVGEINLACGHCDFCAIGLGRHCMNRSVLGIVKHPGAFAEFLVLPQGNLHVVPDEIPTEQAVFVEPLAAACEILDQVQIREGEHAAVLGDGKLGLLVAQVLHTHGCRVTLYGRHENKLALVRKMGVEAITSESRARAAYQLVVDCTGSATGLQQAIGMVRPRGTVVMKSTVHGTVAIDTAPAIVNEITLIGSRCGRFEPAIEMLRSGRVDVFGLVTAEFPLREGSAAFAEAARRGVLKVLLRND